MCGQMCGNPLYTMLLLGIGLRTLSVTPAAIPEIKQVCRSVTIAACEHVAERARIRQRSRRPHLFERGIVEGPPDLRI